MAILNYTYLEMKMPGPKGIITMDSSIEHAFVDGVYSYQRSYGFASGQIPRRSQGTLLPSSGEPKVSNPWNNVQRKDSI
jgi:hypothetical protein